VILKSLSTQDLSSDQAIERALLLPANPIPRRGGIRWQATARTTVVLLLLALTAAAGYVGVVGRNRLFVATEDIRMWWDIHNAFNHGRNVVRAARTQAGLPADAKPTGFFAQLAHRMTAQPTEEPPQLSWAEFWKGYLSFYDRVAEQANHRDAANPRYGLDYSPVRLLIMSSWMKHTLDAHPDAADYRHEFAWPLLHFNTAMAGLASIAMFATVVAWRRRCDAARVGTGLSPPFLAAGRAPVFQPHDRAWMAALFAALILWLNPAVVMDSHGFVQWDTWIIPFVLAAMGFAAMGKWGWAGLALGASMGFKGQVLLILPVFALFPLFRGMVLATLKFAVGFGLAWLAVGLPWLIPDSTAWLWLGSVVALAVAFAAQGYPKRLGLTWWLAVGATTALIIGPFLNTDWAMGVLTIAMPLVAAVVVLPWLLPKRSAGLRSGGLIVGLIALAAIVAAAYRFDGSWNWFVISYIYPSYQYKEMYMGAVANLPMLLQEFGWRLESVLWKGTLGDHAIELTLRHALISLHGVTCVACAFAASLQQKRKDPALLIALAAPWVLAFTLLPQMHERYLTWAAAVAGVGFAVSGGMGLLHWVVISISTSMVFTQMLRMHSGAWPRLQPVLEQLRPIMAGVLILTAMIYLYSAFARSRQRVAAG